MLIRGHFLTVNFLKTQGRVRGCNTVNAMRAWNPASVCVCHLPRKEKRREERRAESAIGIVPRSLSARVRNPAYYNGGGWKGGNNAREGWH